MNSLTDLRRRLDEAAADRPVTQKQVDAAKARYDALDRKIEQAQKDAGYKRGSGTVGELQHKRGLAYGTWHDLKKRFESQPSEQIEAVRQKLKDCGYEPSSEKNSAGIYNRAGTDINFWIRDGSVRGFASGYKRDVEVFDMSFRPFLRMEPSKLRALIDAIDSSMVNDFDRDYQDWVGAEN